MASQNSELDDIIKSNDAGKIKEYVLERFSKRTGPQKSVSFYKTLVNLFESIPETTLELIDTIPDWGYWKDYFMILLYSENDKLDDYIYRLLIDQLNDDYDDYTFHGGSNVSMLAKWIPRQGKSFDKKFGFVNEICRRLYPKDSPNVAKTKYRKMVSTLNKHLGTPEIYLCSKEYDKIDFNKVPSRCLHRNMKTFLGNDVTKTKLQTHLFKKYVALDFKGFMDKIIFKNPSDFEKGVLLSVWNINNLDYADQIDALLGVNVKKSDVLIDTSKTMYDSKLLSISIGLAMLSSYFGNKVIINAYDPYHLKINQFRLFETIDDISKECAYSATINYNKVIENGMLTNGNGLIVITNRPYKHEPYDSNIKTTYWHLTNDTEKMYISNPHAKLTVKSGNFYNTTVVSEVKNNQNKMIIGKIIHPTDGYSSYLRNIAIGSAFAVIGSAFAVIGLASTYYLYL